jgi:hypothetical protein
VVVLDILDFKLAVLNVCAAIAQRIAMTDTTIIASVRENSLLSYVVVYIYRPSSRGGENLQIQHFDLWAICRHFLFHLCSTSLPESGQMGEYMRDEGIAT